MIKIHKLKTWPEFFQDVKSGNKTFEMRENDRNYAIGDILELEEFDPALKEYTGDTIRREVTYILDKQPFVPEKYVCMSIKSIKKCYQPESSGFCKYYATKGEEPIEKCKQCKFCESSYKNTDEI